MTLGSNDTRDLSHDNGDLSHDKGIYLMTRGSISWQGIQWHRGPMTRGIYLMIRGSISRHGDLSNDTGICLMTQGSNATGDHAVTQRSNDTRWLTDRRVWRSLCTWSPPGKRPSAGRLTKAACVCEQGTEQLKDHSSLIITIMYIYHALINALSAHIIHTVLNTIFCTYVEASPSKTIYIWH